MSVESKQSVATKYLSLLPQGVKGLVKNTLKTLFRTILSNAMT